MPHVERVRKDEESDLGVSNIIRIFATEVEQITVVELGELTMHAFRCQRCLTAFVRRG